MELGWRNRIAGWLRRYLLAEVAGVAGVAGLAAARPRRREPPAAALVVPPVTHAEAAAFPPDLVARDLLGAFPVTGADARRWGTRG